MGYRNISLPQDLPSRPKLQTLAARFNPRQRFNRFAVRRTSHIPRMLSSLTPAELGIPFNEVNFRSLDGLKLHGWYIPAQNAKATIILAHGYGRAKPYYLPLAQWLWQGGYNVFTFDFRGHGHSEGESGTSVGYMERLDIHGAVNYMLGQGNTALGVLGVSMGASAAILAASENPHLKAVVADSAYAHLYRSISTQVARHLPVPVPRWLALKLARMVLEAVGESHGFDPQESHPANYIHLIAPRPVFLLHGEADTLTELENGLMLYILAREPKQIWTVPGVGHVQLSKARPEEYRQRVLDFFNNVNWQTY